MRKAKVYVYYRWILAGWVLLILGFTLWNQVAPQFVSAWFGTRLWWMSIHVFTLGVVATSILVWAWHFSVTLLRYSDFTSQQPLWRLLLHTAGSVLSVLAFAFSFGWFLLPGFALIFVAFAWLLGAIWQALRQAAFKSQLAGVVRYYALATGAFLVGLICGLLLGLDLLGVWLVPFLWREAFLLTHIFANVVTFVGITIFVTLGTLLPTTSRTKVLAQTKDILAAAFPVALFAVIVVLSGAWFMNPWLIFVGFVILAAVLLTLAVLAVLPLRVNAHWGFAPQTLLLGTFWLVAAVLLLGWVTFPSPAWTALPLAQLRVEIALLFPVVLVGAAQILLGSLAYLLPMIIGLGPALQASYRSLDRFAEYRVFLLNLLFLGSFIAPPQPAQVLWLLGLFGLFITLLQLALVVVRQLSTADPTEPLGVAPPQHRRNLLDSNNRQL
ncbi:hypothetical protein NXS08_06775 [Gleimia sp. 6138-11-ORH1]|uniref:hypothetical protein n=1 Tax=Gleimia sp. 6138-11-ORH1 TaxID=2973937 RepID=UPI00216A24CB|nr:hypothetical protein [Gleimia sp. 6138-11-ORH1]MCS4485167.1 hypothetical protein [Gleimia sp. 6138-11-ORH1]